MSSGNMATLKASKLFGVIAEDNSDIDVVEEILAKYIARSEFRIRKFVGKGCGTLRAKCARWAEVLFNMGCDHVLLFHDRDANDELELRALLEGKLEGKGYENALVVIPVEEMEAWLLADEGALRTVFGMKSKPKRLSDCESVPSPKEHIEEVVWRLSRKRYINSVHNKRIAKEATLKNLRRCRSFRRLDDYVLLAVKS